ncbi:MAG: tripartite tricarboxylate transporter TctB family protein [Thermodesulfobacteriota bacterium]
MKKAWQIACLASIVIGMIMLISSFAYPYKDRLGPGPGFFPFWLSLIVIFLAFSLFGQTTFSKTPPFGSGSPLPNQIGAKNIFIILMALVICTGLIEFLGFRISLFLFLFFLPFFLGRRSFIINLIFALSGSFGVFHIFYYWLKVPLPMGILGL